MGEITDQKFQQGVEEYEAGNYEGALNHFSELSLDLIFEGSDETVEKVIQCLEMAIECHSKMEGSPAPELSGNDLFEYFFSMMRTYLDTREVKNPAKVQRELLRDIPVCEAKEGIPFFEEEEEANFEAGQLGPYAFSVISAQGPREAMEDEHLADTFTLENEQEVLCFAVLDGHGGGACSRFVKDALAPVLKQEMEKRGWKDDVSLYNALRRAFIRIDNEWKTLSFQENEFRDYSGTTAVVALILGDLLYVANVGDSRAVLAHAGKAIQLSEDAKQTTVKYMREIVLRGGIIEYGRVIGNRSTLDMARSIGDIDQVAVSALPTIKKFDLSAVDKKQCFLILACDGLWDVVSPRMAAEVCEESKDIEVIAMKLEKIAYQRGSTDNVTILVVARTPENSVAN